MVIKTRFGLSVEAFDEFVERPENADRLFEYIDGEAVEVPSNPFASKLAIRIASRIALYLDDNDIGHVTGEGGGYMVNGQRYAPDVAFVSYEKQRSLAHKGYNPLPPDLAVVVISDATNKRERDDLDIKIENYLAAGTLVWVFDWTKKQVEIHVPNVQKQVVGKNGTLTTPLLPDFSLALAKIFKD